MTGVYFYLQIAFCVFLLWSTSTAVYMGVFRAHRASVGGGRKALSGLASVAVASVAWFFAYSWTYLSW